MEHTKDDWTIGPMCDWEIWDGDIHIADVHGSLPARNANARRICQCVNSHDKLLEACEAAHKAFVSGGDITKMRAERIIEEAIAETKQRHTLPLK